MSRRTNRRRFIQETAIAGLGFWAAGGIGFLWANRPKPAHHVAITGDFIIDRIQRMLEERPLAPVDFREVNQKHANEHERVTRAEVLRILRESKPRLAAAVRAIPDEQLDQQRETPVGPMSIAQRLEMVLIGHIQGHKGSVLAAVLQG